jgi:hypothetical protein
MNVAHFWKDRPRLAVNFFAFSLQAGKLHWPYSRAQGELTRKPLRKQEKPCARLCALPGSKTYTSSAGRCDPFRRSVHLRQSRFDNGYCTILRVRRIIAGTSRSSYAGSGAPFDWEGALAAAAMDI